MSTNNSIKNDSIINDSIINDNLNKVRDSDSDNYDFILLIMNCKKYSYKAERQKQTWLKNFDIMPYFHVQGEPNLESDYKFVLEENMLYVKVHDDYNSLPKKVISAYKALNNEFSFKYIFKTDDDQNVLDTKFFTTIKNLVLNGNKKIHYGGHIVNVDKPYLSQYNRIHPELPKMLPVLATKYCSGRFYFLSEFAVSSLIHKSELIKKEYLEDYAIGYNLDKVFKETMLSIQTEKYFVDITFD